MISSKDRATLEAYYNKCRVYMPVGNDASRVELKIIALKKVVPRECWANVQGTGTDKQKNLFALEWKFLELANRSLLDKAIDWLGGKMLGSRNI